MGRTVGGRSRPRQKPSVSAPVEAEEGGEGIRPHVSDASCWCSPVEVEPGVFLHHDHAYVPDLQGVIQGDDAL